MKQTTAAFVLSAIIFVSILVGAYFFAASGITLGMLLTINAMPLVKAMLSINFALFVVMSGTAVAGIITLAKTQNSNNTLMFLEVAYLAGICGSVLIFNLLDFVLALGFGAIGIYFAATMLTSKEAELKKWAIARSGAASAGKITLFIAVGLFLSIIILTAQNQAYYEKNFVSDLLSITIGDSSTLKDSLNEPLVETMIQTQQQTVQAIMATPQYVALEQKSDAEVLGFVATMDSIETQMKTKQYKDTILQEISSQSNSLDIGEGIIAQMPMIKIAAQYAWILYAIEGLILLLFIGGLFTKNIAALIYFVLEKIFNNNLVTPTTPVDASQKQTIRQKKDSA